MNDEERTNIFQDVSPVKEVPVEDDPEVQEVPDAKAKLEEKEEQPRRAKMSKNSNSSDSSKMSKKIFISIDNSPSEVLNLQLEGSDLFFEDGIRFLPLSDEVVGELSHIHRLRYQTAREITEGTLDFSRKRIVPLPAHGYATARNRLKVDGMKPGFVPTWQYADQLAYWESVGARPVTDPDVKTFTNPTGSTRTITESDGRKLVLLEMPEEVHDAMKQVSRDKARRIRDGYDDLSEASLERTGAQVIPRKEVLRDSGIPKKTLNERS